MSSPSLLIVGILCLAIGYFGGMIVYSLTQGKQHANGNGNPTTAQTLPGLQVSEDEHHRLMVHVDGEVIEKPSDLSPEKFMVVRRWVSGVENWLKNAAPEKPAADEKTAVSAPQPAAPVKAESVKGQAAAQKKVTSSPQSIVGQIDEILQQQIAGTPLESKGIRLAETPGNGVCVWIGLEQIPGIDKVTDPEVNEAIRKAVKKWEEKS